MAKSIRIRHLSSGYQAVLNSPGVAQDIRARGARMAQAAGPGNVAVNLIANFGGSKRPMTIVATDTIEAMEAQATSDRLTQAIDAGR